MPSSIRASSEGHGGPESYEALFISALVEEGDFSPTRWGIELDDLECFQVLFSWCVQHQDSAGRAPSVALLKRAHPDFELTADVDPTWAARELKRESNERKLRSHIRESLALLNDGDELAARDKLASVPSFAGASRRLPAQGLDASALEESFDVTRIEVPWPTLQESNKGIAEAETWLFGAFLGVGKTNIACAMTAHAARLGFKVLYHSREMHAGQILHKIRRCLAGRDGKVQSLLDGTREEYKEALDILANRCLAGGSFAAMDPSHGRCTPNELEADLAEYDLVVVDHLGLLTDNKNRRAIEDWRVFSEISNQLREGTLRTRGRMFGLVQINREGNYNSPYALPKSSDVAGTLDLARDADVLITTSKFSRRTRYMGTEKNRNDPEVTWFTNFSPRDGDFREISKDEAVSKQEMDDHRNNQ